MNYETQLRVALDEKAHEIELPDGLAERTLDVVRELQRETVRDRWRARRDSRAPVTGYPRWTYAAAGIAAVLVLFAAGAAVTWPGTEEKAHTKDQLAAGTETRGKASQSVTTSGGVAGLKGGSTDVNTGDGRSVSGSNAIGGTAGVSIDADTDTGDGRFVLTPKVALPPRIVRTASIEVAVRDFDRGWKSANDIAERNGGYVTNSSTEQRSGQFASGTLTMRVPSDKLDDTIKDLRDLGTLAHLQTNAKDVSAPVADVQARRKAAEAEETRLLQLLNNAPDADAVIDIRGRLGDVRADIESLKAQEAKYQQDIDYSTLNVTVSRSATVSGRAFGNGTFGRAVRTGIEVAMIIVAGAVVLIGALIPLALLGLLAWFVVRLVRRRTA